MASMAILGGDYTPTDPIRPDVRHHLLQLTNNDTSDAALQGISDAMAQEVCDSLANNASVAAASGVHLKDDADVVGHTHNVLRKHLFFIVKLFVHHDDNTGLFSNALKLAVTELSTIMKKHVTQTRAHTNTQPERSWRALSLC